MRRYRMGDVQESIATAKALMNQFLAFNPSADDKREVDVKLQKCQGLYDAETIVDLPIITHVASSICFDELIEKLQRLVAEYKAAAVKPLPPGDTGLPWYAWAGIGLGGLVGLGLLIKALSGGSGPVAVIK